MAASVIFHHLVQKDVNGVLRYYADEVSDGFAEFLIRKRSATVSVA